MPSSRLSLTAATIINLNIIVGSGIFINTVLLAQLAGRYGALTYLLVGLLILPLMLCFARLALLHHGGSLYTYGAQIRPVVGFMSSWSYFNTKLASCAVAVHVCVTMLRSIIPALAAVHPLVLDLLLLALFTLLNCYHAHIGKRIQAVFITGKLLPVVVTLIIGALLKWSGTVATAVTPEAIPLAGIVAGIPFVLYAFMGFEASSSLTRSLADPSRDGARAIFISFFLGVAITTLFQYMLSISVPELPLLDGYRSVFPALLGKTGLGQAVVQLLTDLLHSCIALSAAGVAFGILYTNGWNLYELAERNYMVGSAMLCRLNRYQMPTACILIEACIVLLYLAIGAATLPLLQQLAALGVTLTYWMSISALLYAEWRSPWQKKLLPCAGLLSCFLLLAACARTLLVVGSLPVLLFGGMLLAGLGIFYKQQRQTV